MRSFLLLCGAAFLPAAVLAQDPPSAHERAVAEIKRLGGEVRIDKDSAGTPTAVVLTGAGSPADCLPLLKDVRNLRTCDL